MNFIHSIIDPLRDKYASVSHTSTFRSTGQITPEEFLLAGDFLVYKFPSWSWSSSPSASKRVSYLPEDKQFLVTRNVPCYQRLDDNSAAAGGDTIERDGDGGEDDEDGWLRTGADDRTKREAAKVGDVRTLDGSGNLGESGEVTEDDIPDMEDEEDDSEAIIRDTSASDAKSSRRLYTLYITYTPYYRTPRLYLSGSTSTSQPLPPKAMMEDIIGDYKDKTVTLEEFPFHDSNQGLKMASIHPCRHASVMKVLLDRADAALKLRREKIKRDQQQQQGNKNPSLTSEQTTHVEKGMEGLVEDTKDLHLSGKSQGSSSGFKAGVTAAGGGSGGDEWEVLQRDDEEEEEDESAIRVDQYLVVFLKFLQTLTPCMNHDFTMSI